MNKEQRIQFGIAACVGLVILLFGIMPIFSYREEGQALRQIAQKDYVSLSALATLANPAKQANVLQQDSSLFGRINKEAERLSLSNSIEALRPVVVNNDQGEERIDLGMTGLYLEQAVAWLFAMESYADTRVESLTITRTDNDLLDVDMIVIRQGAAK